MPQRTASVVGGIFDGSRSRKERGNNLSALMPVVCLGGPGKVVLGVVEVEEKSEGLYNLMERSAEPVRM